MSINKFNPTPRKFYKTNFVELLELLTPDIYQSEDLNLSGIQLDPLSEIINSHVTLAANIASIIPLSSIAGTQTASLNSIDGISQYFIKQNELTKVSPTLLETKILNPLGTSLTEFETSSAFVDYLRTLLPKIVPASTTKPGGLQDNISTLSALTNNTSPSSVHNYLTDNLGWLYFLNTSGHGGLNYSPSSFVLSSLGRVYFGDTIQTVDGVKGLAEYVWRNYETCSTFRNLQLLPSQYTSGITDSYTTELSGVLPTYTSGTQKLENLKTLIDVIYSPLYIDQQDFTVKTAFDNYIDAGAKLSNTVSKGPYRKFLTAAGYQFADISDEVENLSLIYDITNVSDSYLPYLAQYIGWNLKGNSPAKWRQQIRTAVSIYKKTGTLEAIQAAVNNLITNDILDVSGKTTELWESYIPFLIWYSLASESPLFKDLTTWTQGLAFDGGVNVYSLSSLEENLKMVTDSILLDAYKAFPDNFRFKGINWPVPRLYELDNLGCITKLYTVVGDPKMKPFFVVKPTDNGYQAIKQDAKLFGEGDAFDAAYSFGPLGEGVYIAGEDYTTNERPLYLSATGDLTFLFNYRERFNYPIPPFEEIRFFEDCVVDANVVEFIVERLKCFKVREAFADQAGSYILDSTIYSTDTLGSLNSFLFFFNTAQVPPNFNDFICNISQAEKTILGLWNGKSSHVFINFQSADFDFASKTLDSDSRYALYESARIAKEFSPAHAIMRVNLNASASDNYNLSSSEWDYYGYNKDDTSIGYTSASIISNFEYSGVNMGAVSPGTNNGRGGLNTFWRHEADSLTDALLSSTTSIVGSVPRRSHRRRNFHFALPKEGYYDRTGFNGPLTFDPSVLEYSMPSSLGELTLGYVASAGIFFPIVDPINPSGVWDPCENLNSKNTFSGTPTSATFPYRGLTSLTNSSTDRYNDRCQAPYIYIVMHNLMEEKAKNYADQQIKLNLSAFENDEYWKNNIQSFANRAITSGYIINSIEDYRNFSFGSNLHKLHRDYCKWFLRHGLAYSEAEKTGGNIFSHVFGRGLFNCDFSIEGSSVNSHEGYYIASSIESAISIAFNDNSGVFGASGLASMGTYIASSYGQAVIPLSGSFTPGQPNHAELRNPHILSGIEFVQTSGASETNQFTIYKLNDSFGKVGLNNFLINNTIIKCKALNGLPRLRFDLSAYGERKNYFIRDHKFKLSVKALVGEDGANILGGGTLGVWIHTNPISGYLWSWTNENKWVLHKEDQLSVNNILAFTKTYPFNTKQADETFDKIFNCLANTLDDSPSPNSLSINNLTQDYFETFDIEFDTRNYTIHNNYEYLKVIPVPEEYYKFKQYVNLEEVNYTVEVFFVPNSNTNKYLLLDDIQLQDLTLRDWAGIGTGTGIETSGIPLRRFVQEDRLYLNKAQLRETLKFFNGLAGLEAGEYNTSLNSRDATISSPGLELSGGSRLNYRIHPVWVSGASVGGLDQVTIIDIKN